MTATLPEVDLGVNLDDEVECDAWEDVDCSNPAHYIVCWSHEDDGSTCPASTACHPHMAEIAAKAHLYAWQCTEHDRWCVVTEWMPL